MKIHDFLEHHGIAANPFAEEDAQTDQVFKDHCIDSTYHPTWDKVYGNPADPSTAVVFGEKGAGKTALRLQIVRRLAEHNRAHPDHQVWVVEYDDFNPFLDHFRDRLGVRHRRPDRALAQWKLWDHMDAILSLGVTKLVDRVLAAGTGAGSADSLDVSGLDRSEARDLLLLAACYDQSTAETIQGRWGRLRRALRFRVWTTYWDLAVGIATTLLVAGVLVYLAAWNWLEHPWAYLAVLAGWLPRWGRLAWRQWQAWRIARSVRVGRRPAGALRRVLVHFAANQLAGQPLPDRPRTDDRYALLDKFQGILRSLGYVGIVVLVDRVDEPHFVNGSVELMRALLWPMLDNKFLKHPGVGFKLLLPIELAGFLERESRDFFQRARLDKQNLIPSLEWTGEALYDVAAARIKACAAPGRTPGLRELFDRAISERRLIEAFRALRVPRHLFKFMYRLFVAHCNAYSDESPVWEISSERFESTLALYLRDQDAVDRGLRAG